MTENKVLIQRPPAQRIPYLSKPNSGDACSSITNYLMQFNVNIPDREFSKKAIESLIKRLKDKRDELDEFITAAGTRGEQHTKCITIPRTLDGRLQVAGRKGFPHVVYSRIFRWPDLQKNELKHHNFCVFGFDMKSEQVCLNPYHYERVIGLCHDDSDSVVNSPTADMPFQQCQQEFKAQHHRGPGRPPGSGSGPKLGRPGPGHLQDISKTDTPKTVKMTPPQRINNMQGQMNNISPIQSSFSSSSLNIPQISQHSPQHGGVGLNNNNQDSSSSSNVVHGLINPQQQPPLPPNNNMMISPAAAVGRSYFDPQNYAGHNIPLPLSTTYSDQQIPSTSFQLPPPNFEQQQQQKYLQQQRIPSALPLAAPSTQSQSQSSSSLMSSNNPFAEFQSAELFTSAGNRPTNSSSIQQMVGQQAIKMETESHDRPAEMDARPLINNFADPRCVSDFSTVEHRPPNYVHGLEEFHGLQLLPFISDKLPPVIWGSISYYEYDRKVGDTFSAHFDHPEIFVDGGLDTRPNRFCLGSLQNVGRTDVDDKFRKTIGRGIRLNLKGEGDIWLTVLSKKAVFVQSYHLDLQAGRRQFEYPHKFLQFTSVKIFDLKQCFDTWKRGQLDRIIEARIESMRQRKRSQRIPPSSANRPNTQQDQQQNDSDSNQSDADPPDRDPGADDFRRICTVRIGFIKGFGLRYSRRSIEETPCWIELHLNRALQILDEVINTKQI